MRRLSRAGDDRGAVIALFAVLLSTGVLLGMAALVIDVGSAYDEREQLASGAEAASWAVAQYCIANPTCDPASAGTVATTMANANARDGFTAVRVCGSAITGGACTGTPPAASATNLRPCLGTDPAAGKFVKVRTFTRTGSATGPSSAPTYFAGAIGAKAAYPEACSRVQWGPPTTLGTVMAFGLDACTFGKVTATGYGSVSPTVGHVNPASTPGTVAPAKGITGTPTAHSIPIRGLLGSCTLLLDGGVAWFASAGSCTLSNVKVGDYISVPLNSILPTGTATCRTAIANASATNTPLLIPIYEHNLLDLTQFHVIGFAALVVTGYYYTGFTSKAATTAEGSCQLLGLPLSLTNCLYGYFTKALTPAPAKALPTTTSATQADYGVQVIARTG